MERFEEESRGQESRWLPEARKGEEMDPFPELPPGTRLEDTIRDSSPGKLASRTIREYICGCFKLLSLC